MIGRPESNSNLDDRFCDEMTLLRLLQKKRLVVLGLNSGTSADGLDLSAIRIDRTRGRIAVSCLAGSQRRYPAALREMILSLADSRTTSFDEHVCLDQALGQFYGRAAAAFIRRLEKKGVRVDAIASHGQTVRHLPSARKWAGFVVRGSLQLGSLEQIASHTSRVTIGDFRQADIALGHEGAPITTPAMERLFARSEESRLIVNLGGMSNFFYFPAKRSGLAPAAADCGPGNSLSDVLCQRLFGERFDRGGRRAGSGAVSHRLLALLQAEPFFAGRTVSTGREAFGGELIDRILKLSNKLRLAPADVLATAAELTPVAIAGSVGMFVKRDRRIGKLYLTGGGLRNRFFVRRLRELLTGLEVVSIATLGFNPDLVEASAYAVMGEATLRSEGLTTRYGRRSRQLCRPVLGRIVQPPVRG